MSPVPKQFIDLLLPDNEQEIKYLSEIGMIELTDEYIQIVPLFSYALMATVPLTPAYIDIEITDLFEKILNFLNKYDHTLSMPYLGDIFLSFIQILYDQVNESNNPNQKKTSERFNKWQDMIYKIYSYYFNAGDYILAKRVASLIHYPDLKGEGSPQGKHSHFDASMFQIYCYMRSPDTTDIASLYSNIASELSSDTEAVNLFDVPSNLTAMLDYLINLYCRNYFFLIAGMTEQVQRYQTTTILAMQKLLKHATSPQNIEKHTISQDRLLYYNFCVSLITKDSPDANDLYCALCIAANWSNVDCRISGFAFALFIDCFYKCAILFTGNQNNNLTPILLNPFICDLARNSSYLSQEIMNCAMVPKCTSLLCLYAFIGVALVQNCICSLISPSEITVGMDTHIVKELLNRSILTKDELNKALTLLENMYPADCQDLQ